MRVGTIVITLHLYQPASLKEKRQILQSLIAKIRHKFNVSIAEIDYLDDWKTSKLGVSMVSNDGRVNNAILSKVVEAIRHTPDLWVEDYQIEIL
ncbi:DUF503 domain-containing protein [Candidatus Acetothermia bacterium]|nr:DUF503 domain-containing protein [Candidatus Acetothermia bacterium]MBI3460231.1 DUF503 domain-containing protein [Candidatus Acetothermia bacterium]MBI3659982.1 DUF503 domain-containing protein [Candidatus Acetothermia bacterium]